jgi:hypothetical protein|tara:strand:- start:202 stop:429 length:228 start_codon:yes stop_codon:yes gene_type:complete
MQIKKKTWVRNKTQSLICGYCETCNRELMSDEGGWIITAEKKYFCHEGKDGSCFDNYCVKQLQLRSEDATYEKEK